MGSELGNVKRASVIIFVVGLTIHPTLAIDNRSPALLFPSCDIAQDIRAYVRYLRMNRFINY